MVPSPTLARDATGRLIAAALTRCLHSNTVVGWLRPREDLDKSEVCWDVSVLLHPGVGDVSVIPQAG